MLCEIDELARELKRPIESTCRAIHVELNSQRQEVLQTFLVDLFTPRVVREEQSQRERVGHFGVVHLHVWPKLPARRFRIVRSKTVNHVVSLRSVRYDTLSIEKITPFHDNFTYATVVGKRPVVEQRIEQQRHHPG